jgi:hypothetical protein
VTAKAVIWDIGNVIVRWDPRTLYSRIFRDPVQCDRFLSSVCTTDWHTRHDLGVSFAENRAPRLARVPPSLGPPVAQGCVGGRQEGRQTLMDRHPHPAFRHMLIRWRNTFPESSI